MEEEIITPEEEAFDYNKLRYIKDNEGYLIHVSLGGYIVCDLGECTEYNGEVPDGYETLEEWHDVELERLNAWKIVDGNLVYDANKYAEILDKISSETEENSYVTHKELNAIKIEQDENLKSLYDEKSIENTYLNRLNVIKNSANMSVEKLDIRTNATITDNVKLFFSTANMLPNILTNTSLNGLTIIQNDDRSIQITGTATSDCEVNLGGSYEQTDSIFYFLQSVSYLLNGLVSGINVRFYDFDGTDRTLVGEYSNEATISFESDKKVTQTTLFIANGTNIDATIYPMLQEATGEDVMPYETYKCNKLKINLGENTFDDGDNIIVENERVSLIKDCFIKKGDSLGSGCWMYFCFPDDLYKILPSEDTTIINFGVLEKNRRIYVEDKKIYLQYPDTTTNTTVSVLLYDNETQKNLTTYQATAYVSNTVMEVNALLDIYTYISTKPFEDIETIDLGYVTMPSTYYHTTNVYSDKATETKVFYRNVEKLNTEIVKIGTFTINDDGLTSDITTEYDFTEDDRTKISQYLLGQTTLTYTEKLKYDLDGDGKITAKDLLLVRNLLLANITTTESGSLEINSKSPFKTLVLKDKDGNEVVNINLLNAKLPKLEVPSIDINGRPYGYQEILWEGQYYMNEVQEIDLSETPISEQPNGIVLVFSAFENKEAKNQEFVECFVPKEIVSLQNGKGHSFFLNTSGFGKVGAKYIYIYDNKLKGHENNPKNGTGSSGITYTNSYWVLRYVIGV